eukprot:CAMPEP_0119084424 /NCGR_PEP_ID=MMETSP1178-20130426/129639_1 /TAXON_ID=33656 /ORGANISM="unid sp, Strain CCMP2000" /LENGTH=229 /DNA_ID=CAMNT_0007067387 /DNA_START=124 /DNA_END=809 /DNA_ORIENTATION=+
MSIGQGFVLPGGFASKPKCLPPVRCLSPACCEEPSDEILGTRGLNEAFANELSQRGLLTSLQAIEQDGPSAFKDPRTIVEYVMLCLQHRGSTGVAEAFRFTMPPSSAASATHGTRQVARRISWEAGRVIEGTACGRTVDLAEFAEELSSAYAPLCGCATWRFANPPGTDLRVPGNEHKKPSVDAGRTGGAIQAEGWSVTYLVEVDDTQSVLFELVYDWGAWCYCIVKVS